MTRHSRLSRLEAEDRGRLTRHDIDSLVIALRDDAIIAGRLEDVCRETRGRDAAIESVRVSDNLFVPLR